MHWKLEAKPRVFSACQRNWGPYLRLFWKGEYDSTHPTLRRNFWNLKFEISSIKKNFKIHFIILISLFWFRNQSCLLFVIHTRKSKSFVVFITLLFTNYYVFIHEYAGKIDPTQYVWIVQWQPEPISLTKKGSEDGRYIIFEHNVSFLVIDSVHGLIILPGTWDVQMESRSRR